MKLGLNVGYWGLGIQGHEQLELCKEAEALDYDSVWAAEAYGSDTATVLAWLASNTERIKIGSAIFQMPGRSPAMTAMTAATLDNISNGRMILGIGSSGPQVAEGWHGQRFAHQLERTREYVEIVRMALAREKLEYKGKHYELPLPDGPGKALKMIIGPVQERIPVYLAAIGPKNVALTAEIAEGWLPAFFAPDHIDVFRPSIEEGAKRAGRSPDELLITPTVSVSITEDIELARNFARPYLALYVGGMGSRQKNFYKSLMERYGYAEAAQEVQDLYLGGKKAEAMAALPDEMIDMVHLCGPKERVKERLEVYRDAGVDTLMASPTGADQQERIRIMRELAELAG